MLRSLHLENVGPAPKIDIEFEPRLNFITGDNGLGKTFLLDVAWWALTQTWARGLVVPHLDSGKKTGKISSTFSPHTTQNIQISNVFDRSSWTWNVPQDRPHMPEIVLYAQVDGGFSVWDPQRNSQNKERSDRPPAFLFQPDDVWQGLRHTKPNASEYTVCEGLIRDWASWQRENNLFYTGLCNAIRILSPDPNAPLRPGPLKRISPDDAVDYPTLLMPHNREVAVIHASSGMRRIIALAYLLVWAWKEHSIAANLRGKALAQEIIFLIDEPETHLHPQWQRTIIPSLLGVMDAITGEHTPNIQIITATHSPLVLASAEPTFDPSQDSLWEIDLLQDQSVQLKRDSWYRRGDANTWLTSSIFDLQSTYSLAAESALLQAEDLFAQSNPNPQRVQEVEQALLASLSDTNRFWVRWEYFKRTVDERNDP